MTKQLPDIYQFTRAAEPEKARVMFCLSPSLGDGQHTIATDHPDDVLAAVEAWLEEERANGAEGDAAIITVIRLTPEQFAALAEI